MRRKNGNTKSNWLRSRSKRTKSWKSNLSSGNKRDRRKSKKSWKLNKRKRDKSKRLKNRQLRKTKKWSKKWKSLKKNSERNILLRLNDLKEKYSDSKEWWVLQKELYLESSLSITLWRRSALDLKNSIIKQFQRRKSKSEKSHIINPLRFNCEVDLTSTKSRIHSRSIL